MKKLLNIFILLALAKTAWSQEAVKAYAKDENSYLLYTKTPYDASKKYTVICFQQEGEASEAISGLTGVANIITCIWKTAADVNPITSQHNITASVNANRTLELKGIDFLVNTTSSPAYLVLLDQKLQLLCCGDDCAERLGSFFPLTKR